MNKNLFPLHPSQKDVFIDQLLDVESPHYNIGGYIKLEGTLDKEKFSTAVNSAPKVFDAYKMRFHSDTSSPSFFLDEDYEVLELDELDFTSEDNPTEAALSWMQERFNTPFEIKNNERLFEHVLLNVGDKECWFYCKYHHLVTDGYGFIVWVQYLASKYKSLLTGENFSAIYPSYAEEVLKADQFYNSDEYELEGEYWKEKIRTKPKKLLQKKYHIGKNSTKSATFICELTEDQRKLFEDLQLLTKVGIQQLTIAALIIYFGKTCNETDFVFGIPLHKRSSKRQRSIIGMFSGIQPFKGSYKEDCILLDFLKEISQIQRKDYRYQNYLIGDLSRHFEIKNYEEGYVTEILINYEPLNFENDFGDDLDATVLRLANEFEVTPLQLVWRDYGANRPLQLHIHHRTEYLNSIEIKLLADRLLFILSQFPSYLNSPIGNFSIVPPLELGILENFNNTKIDFSSDKTVVHLFEEKANDAPEAVAVVFENARLTYRELNEKANQLAHYLVGKGVKEETLVPICFLRGLDMIVAILGILKAGGAYVPIDPDYPIERINYIIEDCKAVLALSNKESSSNLQLKSEIAIVQLDVDHEIFASTATSNLNKAIGHENLAYVIYTSGSTGKPKGAMNEHGAIVNRLQWGQNYFSLSSADTVLQKTTYTFDVSVWELLWPLAVGSKIVFAKPNGHKDNEYLKWIIETQNITVLHFVPSMLDVFLSDLSTGDCKGLTKVLCSGEALKLSHVKLFKHKLPNAELHNLYGPTEAAIEVTCWSLPNNIEAIELIPIGKPVSNTRINILNKEQQILPIGVVGEIHIGGVQVGRGYLGRPDLTAEKFIKDPFNPEVGSRLYKTGDLGRWLPDGNLEYLGRIDEQVKIRGYRIELGEIESVLQESGLVHQSVIVAKEDERGNKRLIGYVVCDAVFNAEAISQYLRSQLPDYMVPVLLVELESLPLTSNGKVDKKALPNPRISDQLLHQYVAPVSEFEITLAKIWQELLQVNKVGIHDNFFQLGGDSIIAIQVVSRAKRLGFSIKPKDLFLQQTISGLSSVCIEDKYSEPTSLSEQGLLLGAAGLLPIQQWFFKKDFSDFSHFNQSVLLDIDKGVSDALLQRVIEQLTAHHDALRFTYKKKEGNWVQTYGSNKGSVDTEDLTLVAEGSLDDIINDRATFYQRSLNIEKGVLIRMVLMKTPALISTNRLLIVIHHLAIDGVSWRILLDDLELLLNKSFGEKSDLGAKASSYRQWYNALQQYGQSNRLLSQKSYWQEVVKVHESLHVDKVYDAQLKMKDLTTHVVRLGAEQTRQLLQEVPKAFHTDINDILLSALARTLCYWGETDKVVIGLEGHGREHINDTVDASRSIGWFTSLFPVSLSGSKDKDAGNLIITTKEQLRQIPDKGLGYGVLKYINQDESLQGKEPWDVLFNYLGQIDNVATGNKWFSVIDHSIGLAISDENVVSEKFTINSYIKAGQLILNWSYSEKHYNAETILTITKAYLSNLEWLITQSIEQGKLKTVFTPSDYGLGEDVNHEEFDRFLDQPVKGKQRREIIESIYRLNGLQQGFLFFGLYNKNAGAYVQQFSAELQDVDVSAFTTSWNFLIKHHTILRTAFLYDVFSIPVQIVHKEIELPIEVLDFSSKIVSEREAAIKDYEQADREKGFDFSEPPLMRVALIKLDEHNYRMLWTSHHIVLDGWSLPVILEELFSTYDSLVAGKDLNEQTVDAYEDYIHFVERSNKDNELTYWNNYLKGVEQNSLLPFIETTADRNKGLGEYKRDTLKIDATKTALLLSYSQKNRLTVNTIIQGVWSILLHHYTGNEHIVYGITVSGRPDELADVERRVGMYINTVPLHSKFKVDQQVVDWLKDSQAEQVELRQYQHTSLNDIQQEIGIFADLFDTTLTFQNYPINKILYSQQWKLQMKDVRILEQNNYPLSLTIDNNTDQIVINVSYNSALLSAEYITEILNHFNVVLHQIIDETSVRLGDINLMDAAEKQKLLVEFNNTNGELLNNNNIINLFEKQVYANPQNIAIVYEDKQLTYQNLNERSNRLAHYLRQVGLQKEMLVPICLDRSIEMMVAILGVLKAGGAYVPIDPSYPEERINYLLIDTHASIVVTSSQNTSRLQGVSELEIIELDDQWSPLSTQSKENLNTSVDPADLAYVIYTSGSTGTPKGVMIEHGSLSNYLLNNKTRYLTDNDDSGSFIHLSYTFDASVTAMFMPLLAGKFAVIGSKESAEVFTDENLWKYAPYDFIKLTPSHLPLLEEALRMQEGRTLTAKLVVGGEALRLSHFSYLTDMGVDMEIVNEYGPTEATVGCSTYRLQTKASNESIKDEISIGKPIDNVQIYLLGVNNHLSPVGVIGEICIGGHGLARGYLNRGDLTSEKFIPHPFSKEEGARLYRTGDLGKWLSDGSIEYLGRKDDQVKVRGYRVELSEVETILEQNASVRQAVVLAREDKLGDKYLVGYIVAEGIFQREAINAYLQSRLPEYMVPSTLVELEHFPITRNGKVDRKALPDLDVNIATTSFEAPRNKIESELTEIWKELLDLDQVGIHDDFFNLGGHSLLAIRAISSIRRIFNVDVSIHEIFDSPTIALLASKLQGLTTKSTLPFINKVINRPTQIPSSFSQERLWFIDQFEGSTQYHSPGVLRLKGKLDKAALSKTLQAIVDRHEVLRTVFREHGGKPYQYIKDKGDWTLNVVGSTNYKHDPKGLREYVEHLISKPFKLSEDYMLRANLINIREDEHVLVVVMHHIASDGWSMPILVNEVTALYKAFEEGSEPDLTPLHLQYADYAIWQRNYLTADLLEEKTNYWKEKLEGVQPLQLPTDFVRPVQRSSAGAAAAFALDKNLLEQLNTLSHQQGTTLFMTLLAAFKVLLQRYSNQEDICVGTSIANRNRQEIESLIGFFVNTLALRDEVKSETTFIDLLQQVKITTLQAYEHQDLPFEKVVEEVVKERDPSRSPLFQVMLVLVNTPEVPELRLGELSLTHEKLDQTTAKFDITFFITETPNGLQGHVEYSTDLYNADTIKQLTTHFSALLSAVVTNPTLQVGLLPMLTMEEQDVLAGNSSKAEYPLNKNIVALFEEQVKKTPQATAIAFEGKHLTYEQLNSIANQLAHYLKHHGINEESLVPLFIERSSEMMIGLLGILKAGAAYVPIDTDFPLERITYMLQDTGACVIVSSAKSSARLEHSTAHIIEVDGVAFDHQPTHNPQIEVCPSNLAYVIYTSGSTGMPKGVMVEHRNIVDYVFGLDNRININACRSFALLSTIATDLGNTVIYNALLSGGTLHLFSKEAVSNIEFIHDYFAEHTIDCIKIVPSHWRALSADENFLLPKKLLVFGGEALQAEVVEQISLSGASCTIVNHYGPTETTIGKLLHIVEPGKDYNNTIPIGKPFANTQVYVLNKVLQLCPAGVPGQLYIAGEGVARGYLNNTNLTQTKFIKDPFSKQSRLMYATGDLVKLLPDGNIAFIGRVDDQVKINGYRIEIGEIESVMQQCELVSQAVVLAKEDKNGSRRLVAYVIPEEGVFNKQGVIAYLEEKLPDYMVPKTIIELESLPLSPNGKVDRKALPDPDTLELLKDKYVAPRNAAETRMVEIWQDVLEVERVGVHDDFFELGGHSLLAVRLISAIRKEFTVEMPISHVFDYPTVAELGAQLKQPLETILLPQIEVIKPRPQYIPLSYSQERLWFIDRLEGSVQYHVPAVLRLKGNLNEEGLLHALRTIVNRHEVLRTVILEKDGQPYQFIKEEGLWEWTFIDGKRFKHGVDSLQQYAEDLIYQPFNLSKDYMIRGHLIKLDEQDYLLVLTSHHIASDGWSRSILVKELMHSYKAFQEKSEVSLSPLPLQFADYSIWQRNYLTAARLDEKLSYWKNKLANVAPLELSTDFIRPSIQSTRGAIEVLYLDKALTGQLKQLSQQQGTSLFMTLLAGFNVLLHRYTGQSDICVGGGIAGRSQHEVEQLIGFFINMLSFRCEVKSDVSFIDLLHEVRKTTLEAYAHQEVPFEKVVDTIVTERDLSRSPIFQVTFILQNTPEVPTLQLGDVEFVIETPEHTTSKFDLTFSITEKASALEILVEYCTDLFKKETILRMLGHYHQLLSSVVFDPRQTIGKLQMMDKEEKTHLLVEFNSTQLDFAKDKSIVDLFEEQVAKTPDNPAVVFNGTELSYKCLNEKANQLANFLVGKGVKKETLVAICIERSFEMIVGILGILKAGGAYVPIDPTYPNERIHFIIKDSVAPIVLTNCTHLQKLDNLSSVEIIEIDKQTQAIDNFGKQNLSIDVYSSNLAYVIYTSGSTGKPKGAMIEHGSVANLINTQSITFNINSDERILQFSNYSFDASVEQIFLALFNGASLYLFAEGLQLETHLFEKFISENKITHLHATPSFLTGLSPHRLKGLRRVIAGGDLCKRELSDKWKGKVDFYNEYGPTETTVTAIEYLADFVSDEGITSLPIGKPIGNVSVYIADKNNNLCAIGIPGELYIGGIQVCRGYLNRPDLTSEKFISNIFINDSNERLYKTGDVARWQSDGNIQFLGRIDDQVKIRGYRIEIGEIESVLQDFEAIDEAVVIAKAEDDNNLKLVNYFVPNIEVVKNKERELYEKQVSTWNALYNTEYLATKEDDGTDPEFDIIGWNDSFTGLPIGEEQMKYWLKDIVDVIFSTKPENVLEIGCGTGLIYYQLAGKVNTYIGTDFSRSSVNQIQSWIAKGLRDYGSTELHVCAAHEVSLRDEQQIDTVIINSVIQYFPGEDYMTNVIENSIKLLKGKGRIIVGDVRDYRLLRLFQSRLSIEKFQHSVSLKEFTWAVEQDVLKEEELCYSPDYFYHLQSVFPEITHVNIQWKRGFYSNELSLYRYNVVIYLGEQVEVIEPEWLRWQNISTPKNAIRELELGQPVVALADVPNWRLWREKMLFNAIGDKQVNMVGDLLAMVETQDNESKAIADLMAYAESRGYRHRLLLDEELFAVNVLFELNPTNKLIAQPYKKDYSNKINGTFTNIPLFADIAFILQKNIRQLLYQTLPEYMIPADFIAVSHLPVTSHGKVDRAFLSQREEKQLVNNQNYQPPATEVEKVLASIWKELLGINRIGIYDNFFEIGGHSLLAVRVIAAIRQEFEIELMVKDIFQHATINDLSKFIDIQLNMYTVRDNSDGEVITL